MGYTTDFSGQFAVTPALKPEHKAYLEAFNHTRRVKQDAAKSAELTDLVRIAAGLLDVGPEGAYYVGITINYGQDSSPDVLDHNVPPIGQPGLWCQWTANDEGTAIVWDEGEK